MTDQERAAEDFEERAAIIEYDGKIHRRAAESLALKEIAERYGQQVARSIYWMNKDRANAPR